VLATTLLIFRQKLLLGALLVVNLRQLTNLPTRVITGFSFLSLLANNPGSPVASGGGETARPLLPFCEAPGLGCRPLRTGQRWHRPAIRAYLTKARAFLRQLILTIQLTWGQPARGTELIILK
jgi:hypothetical protein